MSLLFLGLGIYLPFFPLLLEKKSFSFNEISVLLAIPLIVKVVFTPFITAGLRLWPDRRFGAFAYCLVSLAAFAALGWSDNFWVVILLLGLYGAFWGALIPIGDAFTLTEVRFHGANYGLIRLCGSLSFIVANLVAGILIIRLGDNGAFFLIVVTLMAATASSLFLPKPEGQRGCEKDRTANSPFNLTIYLKDKSFLGIVLASGLIQASHALIYTFGTIYWVSLGFSTTQIGMFWAIGVVAEVVLFTQARRLFDSVSSIHLIIFGGTVGAIRWLLQAHTEAFELTIALQLLHGISFGATHLGVQSFIKNHVSENETPSAQGAIALVAGLFMALTTFLAGPLYAHLSADGFYVMAVLALCGIAVLAVLRQPHKEGAGG